MNIFDCDFDGFTPYLPHSNEALTTSLNRKSRRSDKNILCKTL